MVSAKYITHTLEKLDISKFSEVFRIADTFQSAHASLQAEAIDPTSLPLSPAGDPGAQGTIPTAPATQQLPSEPLKFAWTWMGRIQITCWVKGAGWQ